MSSASISEFVEIMKMLGQTKPSGQSQAPPPPTVEQLIQYLHTHAEDGQERPLLEKRLREANKPNGLTNFEEIIAQHVALNGGNKTSNATYKKKQQAKRAAPSGKKSTSVSSVDVLAKLSGSVSWEADGAITEEFYTDEAGCLELLRTLVPFDGVSVELHRADGAAPGGKTKGSPKAIAAAVSKPAVSAAPGSTALVAPAATSNTASIEASASALQSSGLAPSTDPDEPESDADDDAEVIVHERDLIEINRMIANLQPLSMTTLEELSNAWDVSFPNGGDHILYRTNITERIRYLTATIVVGVADRFLVLGNNRLGSGSAFQNNNSSDNNERIMLANNLVLSLWHGIGSLSDTVRQNLSVIFSMDPQTTANGMCVAVTGLGIQAFFEPLPLPLLQKVCNELNAPPPPKDADPDLLHEILAHRICIQFYPPLGTFKTMKLRCCTQLQVHENAPGSFTCTIDNALLMDLIMLQVHTSNKFSCAKLKWRARIEIRDGQLSFLVWHREKTSFNVHLTLRTSDPKKKKAVAASKEEQPPTGLYLVTDVVAEPEAKVGFSDVVSLADVYRSLTTLATGLRLYNRIEDRVVFQFSMEVTPAEVVTVETAAKGAPKNGATKTAVPPAPQLTDLIEEEENEKRQKLLQKSKQKQDKRTKQLEVLEGTQRESIVQQWTTGMAQMRDECTKNHAKALQKKKERERKQEAAKTMASAELQAQQTSLMQQVHQGRGQLQKLVQERTKEEKDLAKVRQQLETRQKELEQLRADLEDSEKKAENAEQEATSLQQQLDQRKADREKRLQRKSIAPFGTGETIALNHTLAIKDFQSFWNASSPEAGAVGAASSAPGLGMPLAPPHQHHHHSFRHGMTTSAANSGGPQMPSFTVTSGLQTPARGMSLPSGAPVVQQSGKMPISPGAGGPTGPGVYFNPQHIQIAPSFDISQFPQGPGMLDVNALPFNPQQQHNTMQRSMGMPPPHATSNNMPPSFSPYGPPPHVRQPPPQGFAPYPPQGRVGPPAGFAPQQGSPQMPPGMSVQPQGPSFGWQQY
jgi:hypothetical protein